MRVFFAALFALVRLSGIRHGTTVPGPAAAWIPDILGRDFTASAPNQRYIGDMTYLLIKGSKPWYLATVIDLYACTPERLQRVPPYRPTFADPYRKHLPSRRATEPRAGSTAPPRDP